MNKVMANRPGNLHQSGTVLVESAITLLMLLVVLFGIVEAGRFISVQHALTNSARRGARLAVSPVTRTSTMPTTGEITAEVRKYLAAVNLTGEAVVVERPVVISANGVNNEFTRVRVTLQYRLIALPMFSALEQTLKGEALMRNETSP
jgi:Flp pilus assembly protein TadG